MSEPPICPAKLIESSNEFRNRKQMPVSAGTESLLCHRTVKMMLEPEQDNVKFSSRHVSSDDTVEMVAAKDLKQLGKTKTPI